MNILRQIVWTKTSKGFLTILALSATIAGSTAPAYAESGSDVSSGQTSGKRLLIAKGPGVAAVATKIPWQNSLSTTLSLAKRNKKWILVDVYTDWCHWCKRLDADVYAQPTMAQFINKSFICMKADAEKGDGITVKNQYGVNGYPCTLILEPGGKEKGRIEGYLGPKEFAAEITKILTR